MGTVGAGMVAGCTGGDDEPEVRTVFVTEDDGSQETGGDDGAASESPLPDTITIGHTSPAMPVHHFAMYPSYMNIIGDAAGIERQVYGGQTPMIAGIIKGEIDFGFNSPSAVAQALNQGFPIVALYGYMQQYNFSIVVNPDEISSWEDLRGEGVAVHSPSSVSAAATAVMAQEELGSVDELSIEYVLGTPNRLAALQSGQVAAATVFRSGAVQAQKDGYGAVLASPDEYDRLSTQTVQFWVTLETALEDREAELRAEIEPLQQAYQDLYDRDPETITQEAIDTGFYGEFDFDVLQETLEYYRDIEMWPVDGGLSQESVGNAYDLLVETELLEADVVPDYDDLVDDRFLN